MMMIIGGPVEGQITFLRSGRGFWDFHKRTIELLKLLKDLQNNKRIFQKVVEIFLSDLPLGPRDTAGYAKDSNASEVLRLFKYTLLKIA